MNRRNFIRKLIGAGAALYVPKKTYGFLFADKCGSWREKKYFVIRMTIGAKTGVWVPASPGVPDLDCKLAINLPWGIQQRLMSTAIKKHKSGWMQVDPAEVDPVSRTVYP